MNALFTTIKLYAKKTIGFILGIIVGTAFAADLTTTPFVFAPQDEGVLQAQLTASATSATLEPIKKYVNGTLTTGCFNSGSGFLLISSTGGRYEYASFGARSCSASNVTTLSSMRRGMSVTAAGFAAGTGLAFDAGSKVKVVDYPIIYQNTVYKDLRTEMFGSGQITSLQTSQAWIDANSVTSTQRDAFTYVTDGNIIYNTTLGVMQYRAGGAWVSFGSGATIDATTTAKGGVEIATVSDMSGAVVIAGDSLARLVVGTDMVIRRSTGTLSIHARQKLAETNNFGFLSGSLLGQTYGSGEYLRSKGGAEGAEWQSIRFLQDATNSGSFIIADNGTGNILNVTSDAVSFFQIKDDKKNGHLRIGGGTAPTLVNCGTTPSIVGNDTVGVVNNDVSGLLGCRIIFNQPYDGVPICIGGVQSDLGDTATQGMNLRTTATGMVLWVQTTGNDTTFKYFCAER